MCLGVGWCGSVQKVRHRNHARRAPMKFRCKNHSRLQMVWKNSHLSLINWSVHIHAKAISKFSQQWIERLVLVTDKFLDLLLGFSGREMRFENRSSVIVTRVFRLRFNCFALKVFLGMPDVDMYTTMPLSPQIVRSSSCTISRIIRTKYSVLSQWNISPSFSIIAIFLTFVHVSFCVFSLLMAHRRHCPALWGSQFPEGTVALRNTEMLC